MLLTNVRIRRQTALVIYSPDRNFMNAQCLHASIACAPVDAIVTDETRGLSALDGRRVPVLYDAAMLISDYHTVKLPHVQLASEQREHTHSTTVETMADHFQVWSDERSVLLANGTQPDLYNRVHWARSYLRHAGLSESTGTEKFRITTAGAKALPTNPIRIDTQSFRQFPEFVRFHGTSRPRRGPTLAAPEVIAIDDTGTVTECETPEEVLEDAYQNLRVTSDQISSTSSRRAIWAPLSA